MKKEILFRYDPPAAPNASSWVIPVLEQPRKFNDYRGFFWEVNQSEGFGQTNISQSRKNVLRGLHYQQNYPQTKTISVIHGRIFDVWLDLRKDSPQYGKWGSTYLDGLTHQRLTIPKGFAHGFLVLSDQAEVIYSVDAPRVASDERTIRWDSCGIDWPLDGPPILSEKDASAPYWIKIQ